MKKIIAFGMILSMICNSGTLRVEAAESQVVPMEQVVFRAESEHMENATELENKEEKNDILLSCEQIKIAVGESACFYVLCNSENMYDELVITEENSNLIQVKEISSDQLLYEKKGAELLKNAPSGVKWYVIEAKTEGHTSVSVESKGNSEKIQIVIDKSVFSEKVEESLKDNNEGFNEQKISSGWTQDGWYYYVNGEPVRGIVEIQGCCYYFDEYTGRLCKKAQWIEKDGKRYYSNAEGILYQNQMISFGSTYYYMGIDGSVQSGIINASNEKMYYAGKDGIIQKKAQWIEASGKKYFSNAEGVLYQNQMISFGNTCYYMGNDGSVQSGIVEASNGKLYYAGKDGVIQKKAQWIEEGEKKYFSNVEGILYQNQIISFGDTSYYMGSDGSIQNGIVKANNGRSYYSGENGIIQKKAQWIDFDGKRYFSNVEGMLYQNQVITFGDVGYCMGEDASVQYGIAKAGNKYYYTDENTGILIKKTGWIETSGKRYFSKADGSLYQNQFISFGDTYYYCGNDAAIVKNSTQVVSGVLYRFDGNGIMIKEGGWGEYNGNKYYKNPATGFPYKNQWVTFGRTWYYANSQGFMVSGWQTIGGYKYYFYSDTKYMARNVIIEGLSIGDDGRVVAFGTRMSQFTTVSTNNSNGTYNMSKALKSFNQVVIQPGQTISFFDIAGPCGKAEGYLPAGVVGGIGYGGGICQASTTLYGAALRAGLTIVERRNHSVPSTYVPIGQDAMVNYGSSDLKIRNDFNFPVKLVTYTKGKTLYAEVWGTQPSWYDYVSIESWWSGSRSAVAYRKYIKNGQVVKTEQLPSSYY
ncbi:MAG: VanW family protein [Coprococcus phoceensis]